MSEEDRHEWTTARLSDYLDGALPAAEAGAVEAHLGVCMACSELRGDLEELASMGRALGPIEPPKDLWPAIAAKIGAGWKGPESASRQGSSVRTLSRRDGSSSRGRQASLIRRRWLARSGLAAAAMILVTVSASVAWWGRGVMLRPGDGMAEGLPSQGVVRPAAVTGGSAVPESLAQELRELESMVGAVRDRLDPGTVEALERNLLLIERAIEDSYQALTLDPENQFVRDHLERTYSRKRDILREISRLAELAG